VIQSYLHNLMKDSTRKSLYPEREGPDTLAASRTGGTTYSKKYHMRQKSDGMDTPKRANLLKLFSIYKLAIQTNKLTICRPSCASEPDIGPSLETKPRPPLPGNVKGSIDIPLPTEFTVWAVQ